jgi:hypothetical protein
MAESYYGGICLTDVLAALNDKHSAFNKADNGKIYMNVTVWINDAVDAYGNSAAIQLNSKDHANEKKKYIGNLKKNKSRETPVTNADISDVQNQFKDSLSDLPF